MFVLFRLAFVTLQGSAASSRKANTITYSFMFSPIDCSLLKRLDVVNGVRRLDVESDGLAREGLHEDLHAPAEAQHQVQRGLLLDVVIGQRPAVFELLPREDQALLIRRDPLLVLDLRLYSRGSSSSISGNKRNQPTPSPCWRGCPLSVPFVAHFLYWHLV